MKSPFKFLDPYTLADRNDFFGREEEIDLLYQLVFQTPLLLVYGYSGTGKTSLIQCGLAGRFDGPDWYPFFIRRQDNLNHSLQKVLSQALPPEETDDRPLTEQIEIIFDYYLRPVYLIFDQFEELFILGDREEQLEFARTIRSLLEADQPCKIILVMREEFFGQLYYLEKEIPTIYDFRMRVEPMGFKKVQQVISGSFGQFNIELETPEENTERIYKNISAGKSGVQLPYLQVYLDMLWREDYARTYGETEAKIAEGEQYPPLKLTTAEIETFGAIEDVLTRFLQEQEQSLQRALEERSPGLPENTVRQVLDAFVTEEGTKRPVNFQRQGEAYDLEEGVARFLPKLPPGQIDFLLGRLEKARLLRERDGHLELAHDSLAALINTERSEQQRRLNEQFNRLVTAYRAFPDTKEHLSRRQLTLLEEFLPELQNRLDEPLQSFIKNSYTAADQREKVELERQQAELEKERQLRGEAEKAQQEAEQNARQARRRTRLAWMISLLAVVLMGVAYWQYWVAEKQKIELSDTNKQLDDEKANALALRDDANRLAQVAEDSARVAQEQRALAIKSEAAANQAQTETKKALADLQITAAQAVGLLLTAADRNILQIDYTAALEKCRGALNLGERKTETYRRLREIAFFYTESGQYAKADTALHLITGRTTTQQRQNLLAVLKQLDTAHFTFLQKRYYPEMIVVPGGEFMMGSKESNDEKPHRVRLDTFRMAKTETTVWQYFLFIKATGRPMAETPTWQWWGDNPIVNVSWYDALAYANWLTDWLTESQGLSSVYQLEIPSDPNDLHRQVDDWAAIPDWSANGFRLPTEAEWEYAARGGPGWTDNFVYAGSNSLGEVAWYYGNSDSRTHKVAEADKKPNQLGLYDMSGNVWEWCWDWYGDDYYQNSPESNPYGPKSGSSRVLRGGSWYRFDVDGLGYDFRVADRYWFIPNVRISYIGFRLAQGY